MPLSAAELCDLKDAVRRRGVSYDDYEQTNCAIIRHQVTLPGQGPRQLRTDKLREILAALPE
jgi:hypothetical protein